MKIYRFDSEVGKTITHFGSNFVMSKILQEGVLNQMHIGCMFIPSNGLVGYHQARIDQLFLVVQGEGWVRGSETECISIKAGEAVFWYEGEFHESGSTTGMVAIVIEGNSINPSVTMLEK